MGGELPIFPYNHHLCSEGMGVILKEHTVMLGIVGKKISCDNSKVEQFSGRRKQRGKKKN